VHAVKLGLFHSSVKISGPKCVFADTSSLPHRCVLHFSIATRFASLKYLCCVSSGASFKPSGKGATGSCPPPPPSAASVMGVPIIDAGARIVSRASSSSSLSLSLCRFLAKECELYNAVFLRLFFSFGKCFEGLIKKSARSALRYASLKEPPPRKREKKGRRRRHTTTTASSRERRSSHVVVVVVRLGRERRKT
jgi:hypothetical protein